MGYTYKNTMRRSRGGPFQTKPATDLTRWRLKCEGGRQVWSYVADGESARPQTLLEKHSLGLSTVSVNCYTVSHSLCCIQPITLGKKSTRVGADSIPSLHHSF